MDLSPSSLFSSGDPTETLFAQYMTASSQYSVKPNKAVSQADQQRYGEMIWELIKNSQYSKLDSTPSLVQRSWNRFSAFLCWLIGKRPGLIHDEMKLRYAMNLFRNLEPTLLQTTESSYDLPFSYVLNQFCTFCKSVPNRFGIDSWRLRALEECAKLSGDLEGLKHKFAITRCFKLSSMVKSIKSRLQSLPQGQSIYIPGGYHDLNAVPSRQRALYELQKHPEHPGMITLRVYHYSLHLDAMMNPKTVGSDNPALLQASALLDQSVNRALQEKKSIWSEYLIPEKEMHDHLHDLLEVQAYPWRNYCSGWCDAISNKIYAIYHRFISITSPSASSSETRLKDFFEKHKERFTRCSEMKSSHSFTPEPVKLLRLFVKTNLSTQQQVIKLAQQIMLFLEIYAGLKNNLSDPNVRKWLKDTMTFLLTEFKTILPKEPHTQIINLFTKIVSEIQKSEEIYEFNYPPGPDKQSRIASNFPDKLTFDQPFIRLSELRTTIPTQLTPKTSPPAMNSSYETQTKLEEFNAHLKTCKTLATQSNLNDLVLEIYDLYSMIEGLDRLDFFKQLSGKGAEDWSQSIHQLNMLSTQVIFELNKPGPSSSQIYQILLSIKICQQLAIQNDQKTCLKTFCLDMGDFKDILKDFYLDLGSDGPKIDRCIRSIEEAGNVKLDLTDPNNSNKQSPEDQQFFDHFRSRNSERFKNLNAKEKKSVLEEDFGCGKGLLAPQIVHLRSMKILARAVMAKYRSLGSPSLFQYFKDAVSIYLRSINSASKSMEAVYVSNKIKQINKISQQFKAPFRLKKKKYLFVDRQTVNICNSPLDINPYTNPPIGPVISEFMQDRVDSQYKDMGPAVPEPMARRILENCVSKIEPEQGYQNNPITDDGTPLQPIKSFTNSQGKVIKEWSEVDKHHHKVTGEYHTESYYRTENKPEMGLPSDVWAELECMQTHPLGTRIFDTFAVFMRYPGLLGKSPQHAAWQWIFTLNLFRDNALSRYLNDNNEAIGPILDNLASLTALVNASSDVPGSLFLAYLTSQIFTIAKESHLLTIRQEQYLSNQMKDQRSRIENWLNLCHKQHYKPYTRSIHQTYLLINSELLKMKFENSHYDPMIDSESHTLFLELLKSYFIIRQMPQPYSERNFSHEETIARMMHRLFPVCTMLLESVEDKSEFLNSCLIEPNMYRLLGTWQKKPGQLIFSQNDVSIDLLHGYLYVKGEAACPIPDQISHNPFYRNLFGNDSIHKLLCKRKLFSHENQLGESYEFTYGQRTYCIVMLPNQAPILYAKIESPGMKSEWRILLQSLSFTQNDINFTKLMEQQVFNPNEQLLQKSKVKKSLPEQLFKHFCWVSPNGRDFYIENEQGTCLFKGKFSTPLQRGPSNSITIAELSKRENDTFYSILNPWENGEFNQFLAISSPRHIVAKGNSKGKIDEIKYTNYNLDYKWNPVEKHWECLSIPGYYLSEKKIESLFLLGEENRIRRCFFDTNFKRYHLLEHPNKAPRLVLPFDEYKESNKSTNNPLLKHNNSSPIPEIEGQDNHSNLTYQYTIDPLGTLKGTPEGYLYLSYVLFTQGKFEQAIFYLKKAQDIKPEQSAECRQVLEWMRNWKPASLDSIRFMIHVNLLFLDQSPSIKTSNFDQKQKELLFGLDWCSSLEKGAAERSPPPYFKLSIPEQSRIKYYRDLLIKHRHEFSISSLKRICSQLDIEIADAQEQLSQKEDDLTQSTQLQEIRDEIERLRNKILQNSQKPQESKKISEDNYCKPIFPLFDKYLIEEQSQTASAELQGYIDRLDRYFKTSKDLFLKSIGEDLVVDTWLALTKQNSEKNKLKVTDKELAEIEVAIKQNTTSLMKELKELKRSIMKYITIPKNIEVAWDSPLNQVKEQSEYPERYFSTVLYACGANDWDNLKHFRLEVKDINKTKELVRQFLEVKTVWQQHNRALNLISQYKSTKSLKIKNRLGELLATKRHYNHENDPYAAALLLLECEQGIIARKTQIEHFRTMMENEQLFKQEALASGKTTFLRNIISKLNANGCTLACLITLEHLIPSHHKQLETANSEAYGDKVHRFEFNRQTPTDTFSSLVILRKLLKIIVEKGRLDFTPNDILSLHHALILKHTELENPERSVNEIHDEIDILQDIISVFENYAKVYSDEIDKILEANKQHNYSIGKQGKLNPIRLDVGLQLTEWILSCDKYKLLFRTNSLWTKSTDQQYIKGFVLDMAWRIYDNVAKGHIIEDHRELFIRYLTTPVIDDPEIPETQTHKNEITNFRNDVINRLPEEIKLTIKCYHKFLQKIAPNAFNKRNGLNYIRSKEDGTLVKPPPRNGYCNELSEFGCEEETIWNTCLNYMHTIHDNDEIKTVGGVTVEQISQLVLEAHNEASRYILNYIKENQGLTISFRDTPAAIKFHKQFGIELENVVPEDFPNIAKAINEDPALLKIFLRSYVFAKVKVSPYQIVGTPHHLTHMFKLSGSTGTSNIHRSLTKDIKTDKQHYKQPGVDGAVILALLKDFVPGIYKLNNSESRDESQTFVLYNNKIPLTSQFAELMQKKVGTTFIDCAPAFPGLKADQITHSIAKQMPDARLRFTDKDDHENIYDTSTGMTSPEGDILLEDAYVIMDHAQTRGTHKELNDLAIGILPINKTNTLTVVFQGSMRMRKLGKGHKIRVALDGSTYRFLKRKPDPVQFIIMLATNEVNMLRTQHHDKSELQKIQALSENPAFDTLKRIKNRKIRVENWKASKDFFIKPTQEALEEADNSVLMPASATLEYTASQESKKIKEYNERLEKIYEAHDQLYMQSHLTEAVHELDMVAQGKHLEAQYLSKYLSANQANIGIDTYVQRDLNMNNDRELELELDKENIAPLFKPRVLKWMRLGISSLNDLVKALGSEEQAKKTGMHCLKSSHPYYDSNLFVTQNLFDKSPENHIRVDRVAVIVDRQHSPHKVYFVAGSGMDFNEDFKALHADAKKNKEIDYYICNIFNSDQIESHLTSWKLYEPDTDHAIARALMQFKFFTGEIFLREITEQTSTIHNRQLTLFSEWLVELSQKYDLSILEKELKEFIVTQRESMSDIYHESRMASAFREVKKLIGSYRFGNTLN